MRYGCDGYVRVFDHVEMRERGSESSSVHRNVEEFEDSEERSCMKVTKIAIDAYRSLPSPQIEGCGQRR